jgi:transcriptional regulator with XRE-family HTH domain
MTFGEILRTTREKRNLSQEDAARAIEKKYGIRMSPSYLSMIENGTRENLTVKALNALLDFFNLPFESALSLFKTTNPQNCLLEESVLYDFQSSQISEQELKALPVEARQMLHDFAEFLIQKYMKPTV